MAADAERFLHQVRGAGSQRHDSAGWLQQAGLNIRKASDAQHLEAIALAYATFIRISTSPLHAAIMAEVETLSGRKRSRTTCTSSSSDSSLVAVRPRPSGWRRVS
ncbi:MULTISPECIES: hypothetical protein [unclassified Methylobacterium]|uniref:hypothetical protein n=1 Tax=unclassified Methylobacterium TaxID=2615210 RepID=UPI00226A8837|nr:MULTISPECIES: hypothetical protein [unclassified Methylobacterium]